MFCSHYTKNTSSKFRFPFKVKLNLAKIFKKIEIMAKVILMNTTQCEIKVLKEERSKLQTFYHTLQLI